LASAFGDLPAAIKAYEEAMGASPAAMRGKTVLFAGILANQGNAYRRLGDYSKAEERITAAKRLLADSPDRPDVILANMQDQLGSLYLDQGKFASALVEYEAAFSLRSNRAASAFNLGTSHQNLGVAYGNLGRWDLAEAHSLKGYTMLQEAAGNRCAGSHIALGNLVALKFRQKQYDDAIVWCRKLAAARLDGWSNVLMSADDSRRLAYHSQGIETHWAATLGPWAPELIADTLLHNKAIVLDSLLEERRVGAEVAGITNDLVYSAMRDTRQKLERLELLRAAGSLASNQVADLAQTQREMERLNTEMARTCTRFGVTRQFLSADWRRVRATLPAGSAFVDFVRYVHYVTPTNQEVRYGAVLLCPTASPKWIPLTNAIKLDEAISGYQKAMRHQGITTNQLDGLSRMIWIPIEKELPAGTHSLVICADGALSFVSFATLWRNQRFLGEDFAFRYVSSGRDLIARPPVTNQNTAVRIWADVDFGDGRRSRVPAKAVSNNPSPNRRGIYLPELSFSQFDALTNTAIEATGIMNLLKRNGYVTIEHFTGKSATEESVRRAGHPWILHFATHGYFLSESFSAAKAARDPAMHSEPVEEVFAQPGRRGWIVLSDANDTLADWRRGVVPEPSSDGILMAEEIAELNLDGTWLVVLSACDSGVGVSRSGEGVLGLQRAFLVAGARNVVMTLWPVHDQHCAEFMEQFYREVLKLRDAPAALAQAQKNLLRSWRTTYGPAQAARWAGPFVISSSGK
jgi:CHAT domain-containing protein